MFHQDTNDGNPSTDFGHVIESLNKLDAGSEEKILLMSRDSKNILVVTYNDIRSCLDEAFSEIIGRDSFRVEQFRAQDLQRAWRGALSLSFPLFSSPLFSPLLPSCPLFSPLLFSPLLFSPLLFSPILFSPLLFPVVPLFR